MDQATVDASADRGIGTITFSHPKANSLPLVALEELAGKITELAAQPDLRAIVLRSEGEKAFCAGASFSELLQLENEEQATRYFLGFAKVILAMVRAEKAVVCRIQGKAVGGAVGLIAAADYSFATAAASVRLSELSLGFGPFVVSLPIIRKIGTAAFSELAIGTEWREPEWCRQHGLFSELHPDIAALDAALDRFLDQLATRSPQAIAALKALLREDTVEWEALLTKRAREVGRLVLTEEVRTKLRAAAP